MKTTPKDFFLHAGATIALYLSAVAIVNLAFAIINKIFPDALAGILSANPIVWPVSLLIVTAPILYVIEWFINRDIGKMPEKKEIWIRKWRIYLTLFLTALTMAIDLVALINVYLNGEISDRFVWKVVIVFFAAAFIFAYYILTRIYALVGPVKAWRIVLAWIASAFIVAAIVGGFVIVGSPAKQRSLRFDEQRISDLNNIQFQIGDYAQINAKLPPSLADLESSFSGFSVPADPETAAAYEYSMEGTSTFELCATFDLSSSADPNFRQSTIFNSPMMPAGTPVISDGADTSGWNHSAGRVCFVRNISAPGVRS